MSGFNAPDISALVHIQFQSKHNAQTMLSIDTFIYYLIVCNIFPHYQRIIQAQQTTGTPGNSRFWPKITNILLLQFQNLKPGPSEKKCIFLSLEYNVSDNFKSYKYQEKSSWLIDWQYTCQSMILCSTAKHWEWAKYLTCLVKGAPLLQVFYSLSNTRVATSQRKQFKQ
jgi:hypothetical protein